MQEHGHYKGVKLASGQDLFSCQLVMDPSFIIPQSVSSPSLDMRHEDSNLTEVRNAPSLVTKVARAICITRGSIQPDFSNLLVVFPPRCKICSTYCYWLLSKHVLVLLYFWSLWLYLFLLQSTHIFIFLLTSHLSAALFPEQVTSIRAVQLSSNVAVCPPDWWVSPSFGGRLKSP